MSDIHVITPPEVMELLTRVVEREGADVKRECKYVVDGKAHCIAACVLVEAGMPLDVFAEFEGKSVFYMGTRVLAGFTLTQDTAEILDAAQYEQDNNKTWGAALVAARGKFDEVTQ
jgi:hypothetical protein